MIDFDTHRAIMMSFCVLYCVTNDIVKTRLHSVRVESPLRCPLYSSGDGLEQKIVTAKDMALSSQHPP